MGQQSNKIIKRRRRADYMKRKKEQAKLGGISKSTPAVKKSAGEAKKAAKKAPAKKAAKKSTAKKAADEAAVEEVADKTVEAAEKIEAEAPAPADENS